MKNFFGILLILAIPNCDINSNNDFSRKSNIEKVLSFQKSKFCYTEYPLYNIKLSGKSAEIYQEFAVLIYSKFFFHDSTIYMYDCVLKACETFISFKTIKNNNLIQAFWSSKYKETIFRIKVNRGRMYNSDLEDNIILIGLKCGIIGIYVQSFKSNKKPYIKNASGEIFID
jgi:hypothetical protein